DFIAPAIPARPPLAREQLDARASAVALDAGICFVGLAGVLAHRGHNDFVHILGEATGIAAPAEENKFRRLARRQAQTDVQITVRERQAQLAGIKAAAQLDPNEPNARISEAPGLEDANGLREERPQGPQE